MKNGIISAASILFCLTLLFSLCSCFTPSSGTSETTTVTDAEPGIVTTDNKSPSDPSADEITALKTAALKIINSQNEAEDPSALFEVFDRSFEITDYNWTAGYYADTADLNHSYVTHDRAIMIYPNFGNVYYMPCDSGYVLMYDYEDVHDVSVMDTKFPSDLLTFAGINVPASSSDDGDEIELPEITAESLTVSEDGKSCSLPEEFLNAFALNISKGVNGKLDETSLAEFEIISVSGVYYLDTDSLVIIIDSMISESEIEYIYTVCGDCREGGYVSIVANMTLVESGIEAPVVIETTISDMKYEGNTPLAAKFTVKTTSDFTYSVQGITLAVKAVEEELYIINAEDPDKPTFSADNTSQSSIGAQIAASSHTVFNVTYTDTGDCMIRFESSESGEYTKAYTARVIFDPEDIPEIPQDVLDELNSYIDQYDV